MCRNTVFIHRVRNMDVSKELYCFSQVSIENTGCHNDIKVHL